MVAEQIVSVLQQEGLLSDQTTNKFRKFEASQAGNLLDFFADEKSTALKSVQVLQRHQLPVIDLSQVKIDPEVVRSIPRDVCLEHELVVFHFGQNQVAVAMADLNQPEIVAFIERFLGRRVMPYLASRRGIMQTIKQAYETNAGDHLEQIQVLVNRAKELRSDPEEMAKEVPIISLLDQLFGYAVRSQASDMHLEPTATDTVVRLRIDGMLHESVTLPSALLAPLMARIKILSHLRIDEHMRPQDGRLTFKYHDRDVSMRVAIAPTVTGEKAAIRLLDTKAELLSTDHLGMSAADQPRLKEVLQRTNGLVLVTGPTGSGKTTTLYSILNTLRQKQLNISTIEDPVEYHLPGVNQIQVNPTVGLSFSEGLRSILRQDPDVILVGEIRDQETAQIAIHAALTGHLVVATLHTNSATAAVTRLLDMGIEPFLIASTLRAVVGQRLVRTICPTCRQTVDEMDLPDQLAPAMEKLAQDQGIKMFEGKGCATCRKTGYVGRTGIFELVTFENDVRDAVLRRATSDELQTIATKHGMASLMDDGARLVSQGLTTPTEVMRAIG